MIYICYFFYQELKFEYIILYNFFFSEKIKDFLLSFLLSFLNSKDNYKNEFNFSGE